MQVGDLVKSNAGTKHHGKVGIIVDTESRWPNEPREDEMLFGVLYPDGQQVTWSERNLEIVNASR
jgi:hypothetical protein